MTLIRTTKKWVHNYIKKGIEGLKTTLKTENHGGPKPRITDENKEIILSVLFSVSSGIRSMNQVFPLESAAEALGKNIPIQAPHRCGQFVNLGRGKFKNIKAIAVSILSNTQNQQLST